MTSKSPFEINWPLGCKPDVAALCVVDCIKQPFLWIHWSSLTPLRNTPFPQWIEMISEWVCVFTTFWQHSHQKLSFFHRTWLKICKRQGFENKNAPLECISNLLCLPWLEDLDSIEPFWRFDAYCIEAVRPKMTQHYVDVVLPQMGLSIHELN